MRALSAGSTLALSLLAGAAGCSATSSVQFTESTGTTGTQGTGVGASTSGTSGTGATGAGGAAPSGAGGGIGLGGGLGVGGSAGSDCTAAEELVYVFSLENDIWSFDPPSKTFTKIATPDCQTSMTPNSMAIDRNLVAWLNYENGGDDGAIYTFDLNKKVGCQFALVLPSGFGQVGMGFSTDTVGGTSETLYVNGIGGTGLAKIDPSTKVFTMIGPFGNDANLTGQSAELTGTGDARLFGYFTTFPDVRVAQIDKGTGNILSDFDLSGVSPPDDWAFSFWGGDFYLYAAPGTNNTGNSSVIHYSPSNGNSVDPTYVADVGFQIIGAGVSTCAPLVPPK